VASRSPRVFSAQFHLLLVTSQLEAAEARHREAEAEGRHRQARRAAKELDRLWDSVEEQRRRLEPPAWRLNDAHPRPTGLEPRELLHSRLQSYVHFEPRPEPVLVANAPVVAPPPVALPETSPLVQRLQELFAVLCLIAIAVSVAEIAAGGITQRPALIAAELCALVLAPFAILLGSSR
jgi:hypothetical protein